MGPKNKFLKRGITNLEVCTHPPYWWRGENVLSPKPSNNSRVDQKFGNVALSTLLPPITIIIIPDRCRCPRRRHHPPGNCESECSQPSTTTIASDEKGGRRRPCCCRRRC
jgi:hypothetical protein